MIISKLIFRFKIAQCTLDCRHIRPYGWNYRGKMEKPKKTKILNYINVFRGLAILLIIMGHTMQFGENNSLAHIINCEMICGGTALFIFISGFLFEHLSYKFEYKNYLSKKWTNVVMPYLITAIPGLFFCLYYAGLIMNNLRT